jgi:alkanesulfonate monooxygenase SsuD/methylene tetrahydromethanopterin reductase-like flavin-dependent oxidoreductase (luciferase family)
MKFGLHKQLYAPAGVEHGQVYRDLIDLVVEAERLGFTGYWTTNHHFGSDPDYMPLGVSADKYTVLDYDVAVDPFMVLQVVAANTSRLRVGTALALALYHHPIQLVEQAAMLDVLSGGRLDLGVGKGAAFRPDAVFDAPKDVGEQNRRYDETLEIIRLAWSGEEFEFHGDVFDLPKIRLLPQPIQQPAPLYFAAASESSTKRAAQKGMPYVGATWPLADLPVLAERRRIYLETAAEAGQDVEDFVNPHMTYMFVGESDAHAQEVAEQYIPQGQYAMESYYEFKRGGAGAVAFEVQETDPSDAIRGAIDSALAQQFFGSAETVAERLREYEREAGINYPILGCNYGAMPHELSMGSVRRFGEQVLPRLTGVGSVGSA